MAESAAPGPECVILLERWRAAYIEVPKVACSSIKLALAGLLGTDLEAVDGNPHEAEFPSPPELVHGLPLEGVFTFAFVRNPWDRLVSCYRDKIRAEVPDFTRIDPDRGVARCLAEFAVFHADMSFASFVDAVAGIPDSEADAHFRSQCTFVTDAERRLAVDYVGRFEALAHDFAAVIQRLGIPPLVLPRMQAAPSRVRYAEFYTSRTRDMVAARFSEDLELFGYGFNVP